MRPSSGALTMPPCTARDGQAVARRDLGDVAGRAQPAGARHVLHDEGRVAGHEPAEMAGKQPREGVEAAGRPGRDHDPDRLSAKEVLDRRLRHGRRANARCAGGAAQAPTIAVARSGDHRIRAGGAQPDSRLARECARGSLVISVMLGCRSVYLTVNSLIISGFGSNPRPGVSGSVSQSLSSGGMPVKIASQVFTAAV